MALLLQHYAICYMHQDNVSSIRKMFYFKLTGRIIEYPLQINRDIWRTIGIIETHFTKTKYLRKVIISS